MSAYATHLFPAPATPLSQTQVSSNPSTPTPNSRGCCENGRPVLTDPATGQSLCSCQYSSALLGYSARLPGLSSSLFAHGTYSPGSTAPGYGVSLGSDGSAFYPPLGANGSNLRDTTDAWRSALTQSSLYDTSAMGFYPYGGYGGLDLNARRKNATRESTNTLKAWLHEHIKNPYPTKGEKIMLAIITKMTLTQVSTWFANARRRLKKENKMTWSPRNRSEDGSEAGDNPDEADVDGDGEGGGGHGGDDVDVGPLSPGREIDVNGMTSSRPTSPLSHSGNEADVKERIINVDEDSCGSFKDHDLDPDHDLSPDEARKRFIRDRSPLRGEDRDRREGPSPSVPHRLGDGQKRDSELTDRTLAGRTVSSSSAGSGGGNPREPGDIPCTTSTASSTTPSRPKIWSVSELLHSSSSSSSSNNSSSSSITSSTVSSSHAAMMTAAARAAMLAASNEARGPPTAFPAGIRPGAINSGYLYFPPGASAAWAAAGARFGHLGGYPLSLTHTTLSYPYSLSTHTPSKTPMDGHPAMRGLSMEALREAQMGLGQKLSAHARPNGGLFSPARDIDGIRGPGVSSRLVESNI